MIFNMVQEVIIAKIPFRSNSFVLLNAGYQCVAFLLL